MHKKLMQFLFPKQARDGGSDGLEPDEPAATGEKNYEENDAKVMQMMDDSSTGNAARVNPDDVAAGAEVAPASENGALAETELRVDTSKLPKLDAGIVHEEPYLDVASRCHLGAVRQRNEDACFSFVAHAGGQNALPLFGLFIVADGMGGESDGHKASRIVSRTVAHHVLDNIYKPLLYENSGGAQRPVQEVLEEAILLANRAIALPDPDIVMGTTLTAALILASRLFIAHLGDSRAYLLEDGALTSITTDHSFVQALQDAGQITAEEAAVHPRRNELYRAVTGGDLENVDTFTRILPQTGTLVLCSDGLWGLVSDAEMTNVLNQDRPLQEKADLLLHAALENGGNDNITAILVNFAL